METSKQLFQPFYYGQGEQHPLADQLSVYFDSSRIPLRFKKRIPKQLENLKQEHIKMIKKYTEEDYVGPRYLASAKLVEAVNLAIALRRPLLLTGDPGCGKTSLAYSISWELELLPVLKWNIRSTTTIKEGLYQYDAVGRLQTLQAIQCGDSKKETGDICRFISLGPLGTALAEQGLPRVLLIDEIDKSDIDFPDGLLHELEEFSFEIPELQIHSLPEAKIKNYDCREGCTQEVSVSKACIKNGTPPIVVITSNRERELSGAFKRRCIHCRIARLTEEQIQKIIVKTLDLPPETVAGEITTDLKKLPNFDDIPVSNLLDWFLVYQDKKKLSDNGKEMVLKPNPTTSSEVEQD